MDSVHKKNYLKVIVAVVLLLLSTILVVSMLHPNGYNPTTSAQFNAMFQKQSYKARPRNKRQVLSPNRLYTDQIYMISMPKKIFRRSRMQTIFDYMGLDATYFRGVDLDYELNVAEIEKYITPKIARGPVACWQSHLRVWKDIVDKGHETAFIFEDDIDIQVDLHSLVKRGLEIISTQNSTFVDHIDNTKRHNDWDTIFVGHCSQSETENPPITPELTYLRKSKGPACGHGYIISQRGAQKFVDMTLKAIEEPWDIVVAKAIRKGIIHSYSYYPAAITQRRDFVNGGRYSVGFFTGAVNSLQEHLVKYGKFYTRKEIIAMGL